MSRYIYRRTFVARSCHIVGTLTPQAAKTSGAPITCCICSALRNGDSFDIASRGSAKSDSDISGTAYPQERAVRKTDERVNKTFSIVLRLRSPIHGLDGIHACLSGGVMKLYFLESKLAKSADSGTKEYADSVKGFGDNPKQYLLEYDIITDLSKPSSALPEDDRNAASAHGVPT